MYDLREDTWRHRLEPRLPVDRELGEAKQLKPRALADEHRRCPLLPIGRLDATGAVNPHAAPLVDLQLGAVGEFERAKGPTTRSKTKSSANPTSARSPPTERVVRLQACRLSLGLSLAACQCSSATVVRGAWSVGRRAVSLSIDQASCQHVC